jgi:hypothetical protein
MARKQMSEVKPDKGISIDRGEFLSFTASLAGEEAADAEGNASRRGQISTFLRDTGLHKKAFAQMRAGMKFLRRKKGGEQEARAWLESIEAILPIARDAIYGNTTPDMFAPPPEPVAEPVDDFDQHLAQAAE